MCGHAPGNRAGAVFNTGVLWFAASRASHDFAREWALATLQLRDPWSDDQGVFNRSTWLSWRRSRGPLHTPPATWGIGLRHSYRRARGRAHPRV